MPPSKKPLNLKSPMKLTLSIIALTIGLSACGDNSNENSVDSTKSVEKANNKQMHESSEKVVAAAAENPFSSPSDLYLQFPAFDKIKNEHYAPAFEEGMAEERAEIDAIANNSEPPTFENTFVAMEKSGRKLSRVASVFYAMASAHINDDIKALRAEIAPKLAQHSDATRLNSKLFARIKAIHDQLATH